MKIGFVLDIVNLRGMAVAIYDYADHNERLLNNESYLFYFNGYLKGSTPQYAALKKFGDRFKHLIPFNNYEEIHALSRQHKIDFIYKVCWGADESEKLINRSCPWGIHVIFRRNSPYGDKYVYLSEWLRSVCNPKAEFVPPMITLPETKETLKGVLNIPNGSTVLGCYGGRTSFDLFFAQQAVIKSLEKRSDIFYLFMNIDKFCENDRCIFIPGTYDLLRKAAFINSCDAMLHARKRGETFGIAIGEFSSKSKRIITYAYSPEREHYRILGDKAVLYRDEETLLNILLSTSKEEGDLDCYSKQFSPEAVMPIFSKVFLGE